MSARWTPVPAPPSPVRTEILRAFSTTTLAGVRGLGYSTRPPQTRGLGATGQQTFNSAAQIAGATLTTASAMGAGWATAAIPIVGPIIAGVTIGLSFLFARKGPKQKVATTKIVDAVEPYMKQNLEGYLAGPRNRSAQAQALANFDAGWQYIVEHCNIPEMGDPGQRCTDDRKAGACVWHDDKGECWNWFKGYRDPIANDIPTDDPTSASGSGSNLITQTRTDPTTGQQVQVLVDPATGQVVSNSGGTSSSLLPILAIGAIILGLTMEGN